MQRRGTSTTGDPRYPPFRRETELAAGASRRRQALDFATLPDTARPIALATLPPPFQAFFTLSNDCDDGSNTAQTRFHEQVTGVFGLAVSGSIHPSRLYDQARLVCAANAAARPDGLADAFVAANADLLKLVFDGAIDTNHGLFEHHAILVAEDVTLAVPSLDAARGADGAATHGRVAAALRFRRSAGWHPWARPRWLAAAMALPVAGSEARLYVATRQGWELVTGSSCAAGGSRLVAQRQVLDLSVLDTLAPGWQDEPVFHLELLGPPGAMVTIRRPMLLSHLRSDAMAILDLLARLHLTLPLFTSHGIGAILAPTNMPSDGGTDARCLADDPGNPHYCADLLRASGVRYLTTFNNACEPTLCNLDDLIYENELSDGHPVYEIRRYADDGAGAPEPVPAPTLADALGWQVTLAYRRLGQHPGTGGLLYTHTYRSASSPTAESGVASKGLTGGALDPAGRGALALMAERHYNLSGACPERDRVFVAPAPVLLRMAQMRRALADRTWVDTGTDTVHVLPWTDPVTGECLPDAETQYRALRHLPFQVPNVYRARLCVSDVEVAALIRTPVSDSTAGTVMVADISTPTPLSGAVPLEATSAHLAAIGLSLIKHDAGGRHMQLTAPVATLVVRPVDPALALGWHQALGWSVRVTDEASRLAVEVETERGLVVIAEERATPAAAVQSRAVPIPCSPRSVRTVVVPFTTLLAGSGADGTGAPRLGRITAWRLQIHAAPGSSVILHWLALLRDSEQPPAADGGVLLGGRIADARSIRRVTVTASHGTFSTEPTSAGWYLVRAPQPRGTVVQVLGRTAWGSLAEPRAGPLIELGRDRLDIDF